MPPGYPGKIPGYQAKKIWFPCFRGTYRTFSCRKNTEILGAYKIGAAISDPRIADKNFTDTRIFLGHDLNQWAKKWSKFLLFPSFIVEENKKKHTHTHLVWGFFTFQCFVFFLIFAFSCLSFSSFPLLLDFLKPKSGPSNEVIVFF